MKKWIQLGKRKIGPHHPPFIIAEMSGNHNQSLRKAFDIVDAAASAGVDAIKIQTYTADTITINSHRKDFFISNSKSLWKKTYLYDLYKKAHTPWKWHKAIFDYCRKKGVISFSTPFDFTAVDFLESLNVPCYKIASFENADIPLLKKIAKTGKPIILSTGMAMLDQLKESVSTLRQVGCRELILLKCTSSYPASPEDSNLLTIPDLREKFKCQVGLSDHTLGIGVSLGAVGLGATVIEKHMTISRKDGGVDSVFSLEPKEMAQLVKESRRVWEARGVISYGPTKNEMASLKFRRSLYVVKDIKSGDEITSDNVRSIRPSFGLPPKYYEAVLGRRVSRDLKMGTPLKFSYLKKQF